MTCPLSRAFPDKTVTPPPVFIFLLKYLIYGRLECNVMSTSFGPYILQIEQIIFTCRTTYCSSSSNNSLFKMVILLTLKSGGISTNSINKENGIHQESSTIQKISSKFCKIIFWFQGQFSVADNFKLVITWLSSLKSELVSDWSKFEWSTSPIWMVHGSLKCWNF